MASVGARVDTGVCVSWSKHLKARCRYVGAAMGVASVPRVLALSRVGGWSRDARLSGEDPTAVAAAAPWPWKQLQESRGDARKEGADGPGMDVPNKGGAHW